MFINWLVQLFARSLWPVRWLLQWFRRPDTFRSRPAEVLARSRRFLSQPKPKWVVAPVCY